MAGDIGVGISPEYLQIFKSRIRIAYQKNKVNNTIEEAAMEKLLFILLFSNGLIAGPQAQSE
jgi:hypothetical protein